MKRFFVTTLLLVGCFTLLFAEKIDSYKVDVAVEQSGELAITETILYSFENTSKHGIIRDIPYQIKVGSVTKDIGFYQFSVQKDGGFVEWDRSSEYSDKAGKLIRLKIGSASTYVTGKHTYAISYKVKLGVLPAAQNEYNDAIRWNVIGTGWPISIHNINANFYLPASLPSHDISLSTYTGSYGTTTSSASTRWITPSHLQVTVPHLNPYEGATVELSYPSDRLDQNGRKNLEPTFLEWLLKYWHWGALVGFLLYFKKMYEKHTGFVDNRAIAVQYYPPKDMSILEAGLVLDKFADNKDFSAAVLELAEQGYLDIYQSSHTSDPLLKRTEKNSDMLGMDQKYLLDHVLFHNSESFTFTKGSKSKADALQKGFSEINDRLYQWVVADGYMMENPQRIRKNFVTKSILYLLPVIALIFYTFFMNYGTESIFLMIFPIIFGSVGLSIALSGKNIFNKIFGFVFAGMGMTPLTALFIEHDISIPEFLFGPFGVLLLLLFAMIFTYKKIGKFTQKGAYTRKHLLGLQEFIVRVKEDEIHRRLQEDPLYLEKLLPYAVLFGETKHWLSFYGLLSVATPTWYHGDLNDLRDFSSSVDRSATPPSNNTGGGGLSGGGGFSGGGGGGGGGSSW